MHFGFTQCKQKGFAQVYILITLLIAGGLAGAYFLGKTSNNQNVATVVLQPVKSEVSPTPFNLLPQVPENNENLTPELQKQIIPLDETTNWKTYTNEAYKFSFKYPKGAEVQEVNPVYLLIKNNSIDKFYPIAIFIFKNTEGLSRREFFAKNINSKLDEILLYINIKETSVGNMAALRIVEDVEYFKNQSLPYTNYLISSGGSIIHIVTNEYVGKNNGNSTDIVESLETNKLYQEILATFKFN